MVTRSYAEENPGAVHRTPQVVAGVSWLRAWARTPLVRAVVFSRLLVLGAASLGALFYTPVSGWRLLDPTKLSAHLGSVGNVLAAGSVRWDAIHYLGIATQGYKPAGDTGFFPFYPLLIHALGFVIRSDVIAGILISLVSFATALWLLHRIVDEELGNEVADTTVLLLAFAPLTLFFSAVYTESLFLALSVGTFYLARRGQFAWASVAAACAAITHVEGVVLWAPVAYMYWEAHGRQRGLRQFVRWEGAALLLPLAAFFGLLFYMHLIGFGWLAPFTGSPPTGHGHTIAPILPRGSAAPDGLYRSVVGPLVTIWRALLAGSAGIAQTLAGVQVLAPGNGNMFSIGFQNTVYLFVLIVCLLTLAKAWRILPKAYAIYATLVLIVFTMSVVTIIPLRAFDRYMLPAFPLWMMAAKWLDNHRLILRVVLTISPCLVVLYTLEFTRWVMVA